jgi:hypothetical protein
MEREPFRAEAPASLQALYSHEAYLLDPQFLSGEKTLMLETHKDVSMSALPYVTIYKCESP